MMKDIQLGPSTILEQADHGTRCSTISFIPGDDPNKELDRISTKVGNIATRSKWISMGILFSIVGLTAAYFGHEAAFQPLGDVLNPFQDFHTGLLYLGDTTLAALSGWGISTRKNAQEKLQLVNSLQVAALHGATRRTAPVAGPGPKA